MGPKIMEYGRNEIMTINEIKLQKDYYGALHL